MTSMTPRSTQSTVIKKIALVTTLLVYVSGCATMSKEECQLANWQAIGQMDGANGKQADYLAKRSSNCVKNGIMPNQILWEKGRQKGLRNYCTPNNIYNQGLHGKSFSPVCGFLNVNTQNKLDKRYRAGKRIYELERDISRAKTNIKSYEKDYYKLRSGDKLKYKTQSEANDRMIELDRKIQRLRKELWENERTLSGLRQ